ncbi:ComEC/Rec2 family competence protein [Bdellovibrio bacteriovorus]|nr:hydrolase [Bdellovibrio bacteriovorus]
MNLFFFLLITLSTSQIKHILPGHYFVIWNVGQGQWVSEVSPLRCRHFDMGGEFFPWARLRFACAEKENQVFLSHWDWDHIGALSKDFQIRPFRFCLALPPLGKSSRYKMRLVKALPLCLQKDLPVWTPALNKDSNAESHVLRAGPVLLPGDSPKSQELLWRQQSFVRTSTVLVLGHHGSKTSTSTELLTSLPHLRQAVTSARWSRYKHPHPSVVQRLQVSRVPLLRTEDWGHIWIEGNTWDHKSPL